MVTIELGVGITAGPETGRQIVLAYQECTVEELLLGAGVNLRDVGMVLVNKKTVDLQSLIADHDQVHVLGMLCGG